MTPGTARLTRIVSVLSAALPFAFAIIAAWLPRHDIRFLWLAIGGLAGMLLVMRLSRGRVGGSGMVLGVAATILVVALILDAIIIRMMMARLAPGALVVALGFSLCFSFSYVLAALSAQSSPSTTSVREAAPT